MKDKGFKGSLLITIIFILFAGNAFGQRGWLSKSITRAELSTELSNIENWRIGLKQSILKSITEIPTNIKQKVIQNANQYLTYDWPNLPAMVFLQYSENGNRSNYQGLAGQRRSALSSLVIGELMDQKGRFIPQIVNGIWAICEESTWAHPAHIYLQRKYTPLPNPGENVVDLGDVETAALISWTYFLLRGQLDSITSVIPERLRYELGRRVIHPYLKREDFWWMGFHGQSVNNWNPWCNSIVLLTALLTEKNSAKLDSTIYKTMRSVDYFINQYPNDGGCDEGPSYWSVAGGALIKYLEFLKSATYGKINITTHPLIEKMGEYIYKMNIVGNEFVNYGDAHRTTIPNIPATFGFGKACNNDKLKQFAAYFAKRQGSAAREFICLDNNLHSFVEYLQVFSEIKNVEPEEPLLRLAWFPDLQVVTTRSQPGSAKGLFFSAKGGTNGESHNHNDVGNFIIYVNGKPAIIDIGVGTYTRQTFSKDRYEIFTMQSAWHNLPTINGVMQHSGGKFKARDIRFSHQGKKVRLSMDIANAYSKAAAVESWKRTLKFDGKQVILQEKYVLSEYKQPFFLSLITPLQVKIKGNQIILQDQQQSHGLKIYFDPKQFNIEVERKFLNDPKLQHSWSDPLNRIRFKDRQNKVKGEYQLTFQSV